MRTRSLSALCVFACLVTAGLSGCVVGSQRPVLDVQWSPEGGSCAAIGAISVNVHLTANGHVYRDINNISCESRHVQIVVDEGTYTVHVDGVAANGAVVATTLLQTLTALTGTTQATGVLPLQSIAVGTITANWTIAGESAFSGCSKRGVQQVALSVLDETKTKILATGAPVSCSSGAATIGNIPPGTRFLQIDGNSPLTGPLQIQAGVTTLIQTPIDLVDLGQPAGAGSVTLNWTILGAPPIQACGQLGLKTVSVTILDAQASQTSATGQASCTAGTLTISGVPTGTHYIQLDGIGANNSVYYGSIAPYGPITVTPGTVTLVSNTLDLVDLRSAISLDWLFPAGITCASAGTPTVQVQIKDGSGKIIVPYDDASATKPCDLNGQSAAVRLIDMQNVAPKCTIPQDAKGLVVCNITQSKLTISILAIGTDGLPKYGGAVVVDPIAAGKHYPLVPGVALSQCGAGVTCTK